ncbi:MAG: mannose-1-phosphate guanylyltransferase/mannose-6-phosphate isomerase [Deltaproteobacteria bacterium]|jgi:mannose-1-phosphate guanylyltransferase/mannose-6-phosphate isomerase|nr:mannose-1-phosphate guanylyltransferase/mannose-6-phosphate isomerase [Deltaproteobacteria bacterium]
MPEIFPVILSGGSGTRLWPLSRGLYPKQYVDLEGETLFGACLERVRGMDFLSTPLVLCNQEHRFLAAAIMRQKGFAPGDGARLILEPVGRNTAPAIALAALAALEAASDPLLLVLPSDHKVYPPDAFTASLKTAIKAAQDGLLATLGIRPDNPATGYGYIIQGELLDEGVYKIERFVEKPDQEKARRMLSGGNCLWNSGMFVFRAGIFLEELGRFSPAVHAGALSAWNKRGDDLDFIRIDVGDFSALPSISIDYAVMEHTERACVTPLAASWHDLGSWESMHEAAPKDEMGNSALGDVELLDTCGSYISSSSRLVAGIGLRDMVVVESPDAVLVMPKGRGQEVKTLLELLKAQKRMEAETHLKVYRPWGSYETLAQGPRFQVKRILVSRGASLSMQMHHHRAEHWVVVRGTAKITLDGKDMLLTENQSVYIPVGSRHRLENPGHIDLELIEIQSGPYLGEDDIVRFEDSYGR